LGDDWHADHIVPWSTTHRTNVQEMQALCRRCNLAKGARV
jgi:5-methylcytosine-specific restriction endonuclease McrA